MSQSAFIVTIPHSGEKIPPEAQWLVGLPEPILMGDVDRYVDLLYEKHLQALHISYVKTEWHRYAADLNRVPEDVDCDAVEGSVNPAGSFPRGFHWVYSTQNDKILKQPLSQATHQALVDRVYAPFHQQVMALYKKLFQGGAKEVFHLDAHSMPSLGTKMHRDPGEYRADVVVSDVHGKSCKPEFKDLVIEAYEKQGFKVRYNWPYFGGRLTEQYGHPELNQHCIQVELNRSLYMDEVTKKILPQHIEVSEKVGLALTHIKAGVK